MSDVQDLRHRVRSWADEQLESSAPGRRLRIEKALIVLKNRLGDRPCTILDAGAETGLFARAAASRSPRWRIVAIDLSYSALSRGRAATASRPWREQIAFVQADLTCGLGRDLFDAAVMLEALVEIPDDAAALESVAAALRPGGVLVLQTPAHDWTPVLAGADRTWRREARHGYDEDRLRTLAGRAGLDVLTLEPTFHRLSAAAQDVRDRYRGRSRRSRLALVPLLRAAVLLERHGVTWGPARAWLLVAVRRG